MKRKLYFEILLLVEVLGCYLYIFLAFDANRVSMYVTININKFHFFNITSQDLKDYHEIKYLKKSVILSELGTKCALYTIFTLVCHWL